MDQSTCVDKRDVPRAPKHDENQGNDGSEKITYGSPAFRFCPVQPINFFIKSRRVPIDPLISTIFHVHTFDGVSLNNVSTVFEEDSRETRKHEEDLPPHGSSRRRTGN